MLIEFSLGNFLSFKDPVTLSMVAGSIKELKEDNVFKATDKLNLLKSCVIYGANASGKTNLLAGMAFMNFFVFKSAKEFQATEKIPIDSFRLSTETENKPSFFEIIFIHKGIRYRYGFEADSVKIHKEWLFYSPKKIERTLFTRVDNNIKVKHDFKEGKKLEEKTRENALFLSVVAQFNGKIAESILEWFRDFNIIPDIKDASFTVDNLEKDDFKNKVLTFLKEADIQIDELQLEVKELNFDDLPKDIPETLKILLEKRKPDKIKSYGVNTTHKKYNKKKEVKSNEVFGIENESKGTIKIFALSGPIIDTLENGGTLILDELDTSLHPQISQSIVKLFNSNVHNPKNAQLIFATHDTNLLDKRFFRRDQIWFTEKNAYGVTDLYSLAEYKVNDSKIRNDASYQKDYILGKYGAIPFIGNFNSLFRKVK